MSPPLSLVAILVSLVAIFCGLYQTRPKPPYKGAGVWKERKVKDVGKELKGTCTYLDDLKGCKEIVLHEPSGLLFLSCTPPTQHSQWYPYTGVYNTSAADTGYIATYDPCSKEVTKLTVSDSKSPRGLSPFCMDVVPSTRNPLEFTIYVINMRPPFVGLDINLPPGIRDEIAAVRAKRGGPDPSVEVFRYILGSDKMQHISTWIDEEVMIFPSDVVGLPDGEGFWFTNVYPYRAGASNYTVAHVQQKLSSIGFCGIDGCKFAATGLDGANGITRSPFHSNDTFYVGRTHSGGLNLFTRQPDNRLLVDEYIDTEDALGSLMVDSEGAIWAIGWPRPSASAARISDPAHITCVPSSVFKITRNTRKSWFFGKKEKYSVQKVLEDDGTKISGIGALVHDATRGRLFMHGLFEESLIICQTK